VKLAIIGLSNSGKTTIFNALTGQDIETTIYPTTGGEPNIGVVKVPDSRLDKLSGIYKPKKTTYATVEYIDYLGLTKGDTEQNRKVYDLIKDVDAVVHVVRAFEDDAVAHPMGDIDVRRDAEALKLELIFCDLELVEKRLERMEQGAKRGKKPDEAEKRLLLKFKDALERETALRDIEFNIEEQKAMRTLQFLSTKPEIVVINLRENDLNTEKAERLQKDVQEYLKDRETSVITLCGKMEMEIAQLLAEEARAFLDDLKIKEPALNKLIRLSYNLLSLISFFTVGEDEVKAWTIKQGMEALKAAGKIHSDIERGFIRAEVIGFNEFIDSGASMAKAKEKGLLRLEGKNYIVKDGDIINFRFNI